jgi:hypothetical protein
MGGQLYHYGAIKKPTEKDRGKWGHFYSSIFNYDDNGKPNGYNKARIALLLEKLFINTMKRITWQNKPNIMEMKV